MKKTLKTHTHARDRDLRTRMRASRRCSFSLDGAALPQDSDLRARAACGCDGDL
jgi:hypothetical protein